MRRVLFHCAIGPVPIAAEEYRLLFVSTSNIIGCEILLSSFNVGLLVPRTLIELTSVVNAPQYSSTIVHLYKILSNYKNENAMLYCAYKGQ